MTLARSTGYAVAFTALLLSTSTGAAQDALTTRNMVALSPPAANHIIQNDLLSIFDPISQINRGNLLRIRGIELFTHPFGTEFDGICRRDAVNLMYAPTDTIPKPADQPLRPYSVEARPLFHAIRRPSLQGGADSNIRRVWSANCNSLDRDGTIVWFEANNVFHAAQAVNLLDSALDQLKSGTLKVTPCSILTKSKNCEQEITTTVSAQNITDIDTCDASFNHICYIIHAPGVELTIVGRETANPMASIVESISAGSYIVVT